MMSKWLASLGFLVVFSPNASAGERPTRDCFQIHMEEAIHRNQERRERYSRLTNGDSEKITRILILVEKLVMPVGWYFDRRARKYQKQGIGVLCDELISLHWTPEFRDYVEPTGEVTDRFQPAGAKEIKLRLKGALKKEGWSGLEREVSAALASIANRPQFNCLLRNDLITIQRSAVHAQRHNEQAAALRVSSPDRFSRLFVNMMISGLGTVEKIDRMAFPIQRNGVPIICQDFPGYERDS